MFVLVKYIILVVICWRRLVQLSFVVEFVIFCGLDVVLTVEGTERAMNNIAMLFAGIFVRVVVLVMVVCRVLVPVVMNLGALVHGFIPASLNLLLMALSVCVRLLWHRW